MKKGKNGSILEKLIYILAIVILIGMTTFTIQTIPNIKLPKKEIIALKNLSIDKNKKITLSIQDDKIVTSRSSDGLREIKENKKTEKNQKEKKDKTKYISINQVKISKKMDLTKRTGLCKKDFIKLMSKVKADTTGFFEENAGIIYDLCKKYNINEIFFCGLISAESGWNIAQNHRKTHNYISLMKNGRLIKYSSLEEGLEVAAKKLHNNYLTPGGKFYHGKTLFDVKTNFCPASSTWVKLVYGRMQQIVIS